ncbi:MAG: hypothetical protein NC489_27120, partial [Ruminococcus flavefaciens]|nr:hypothetical protein [Ruminococcus flavefaciens]
GGWGYWLPIKQISVPLTNKCNNYCIMCHACDKSYENHTYYNGTPFELSLKKFKHLLPMPKRTLKEKICGIVKTSEDEIEFVFGSAESLLSSQCYEIFRYIKTIYPNSRIRIISNGTIPPKPLDIVKYIDRIGFSVDGCTKETYEYLRTPAKFDHAIKTIRQWDETASEYNDKFSFGFGIVLSSRNIREFAGIVQLAAEFKHIDSVYVQPIILYESLSHLENLLLNKVDPADLEKHIEEAKEVSKNTGVRIDGLDSLASIIGGNHTDSDKEDSSLADFSKYCRYMWNGILNLNDEGKLRYLCCYMTQEMADKLMSVYDLPTSGSIGDIYNSKEFWTLRRDMLEGKLTEYCVKCNLCNAGYEKLKSAELDMDENFYL